MVEILNIPIYDKGMDVAVRSVIAICTDGQCPKNNRLISATGAHGLVYAKKNPEFAEILKSFTMNLPDGKPTDTARVKRCACSILASCRSIA
jgi:N-acetylglucosaminyldiphosphoundecaprenol N-acetyl-beta-D-mannosaminyltransferase